MNPVAPAGVSSFTTGVNRMMIRPLPSMSDGWPKATVSVGKIGSSNSAAKSWKSTAVKPPAGAFTSW